MTETEPSPQAFPTDDQKNRARSWFTELRDRLCHAFEAIENDYAGPGQHELQPGRFERTSWNRDTAADAGAAMSESGGGGEMSIMRGRVFEKVGVNISTVHGRFSPDFASQMKGAAESQGLYYANGISLVAHMRNPHVPAAHMNTRLIHTSRAWFGGGGDLNPIFPNEEDTRDFHAAFEAACDAHDPGYYPRFKAWCDEYFYNRHRKEPRGVGGIFYDDLNSGRWENDFAFTQDVGRAFLEIFPQIVRRHMNTPWTEDDRQVQRVRRGRYAEFNLVYDRGTVFGLKTGGNIEAILMSLPPEAAWP